MTDLVDSSQKEENRMKNPPNTFFYLSLLMHEPVKKGNLYKVKHFGITDFSEPLLTIPLTVSRTLNKIHKAAKKKKYKKASLFLGLKYTFQLYHFFRVKPLIPAHFIILKYT